MITPYLGKNGAMRALPLPRGDVDGTPSRNETATVLLSGGTVTVNNLHTKRGYSVPYDELPRADANTLLNFYRGVYGVGPWRFVDPSILNVLPLDVSTCGVRSQASPGWAASNSNTPSVDLTTAAPVAESATLKWTPTASAYLTPGASSAAADVKSAPPILPAEAGVFYVSLKAATAATFTLSVRSADGTSGANVATLGTVSAAVTTAWQTFAVPLAAGQSGALYWPRITAPSSGVPASLWVACAGFSYASAAPTWEPGWSVGRYTLPTTPGRAITQINNSTHTLTLAEV